MNDLELIQDLFGNQVIEMHGDFCLVFTPPAKWRVDLRAKVGHYRNRFFVVFMSVTAVALYYGITLSQWRRNGFITLKFKG